MQLVQVRLIVKSHLTPLQPLCKSAWLRRSSVSVGLSSRRWNSSEQIPEKPFYVTTPIFYVNAAPHIGHLYCAVLADVVKRWQQINGKQAFLLTGTDEHGMKIQSAAEKDGTEPSVFCDVNSAKFRQLMNEGSVSYDFFSRTTDPDHKDAVARFWLRLKHALPQRLGLYQAKHSGWYCVSDECFYAKDLIRPSLVPQTGKKIMINTETDNEVEWIEEETWFFPLTKFKDRLLAFYDENPNWVHPPNRMQEVRNWVQNHLEDLSVTRPAKRLKWGIADPEDSSLTIYVWVDALINYITKTGFGSKWNAADEDMGIWPADVQIIGKDILRFHAIYWPALLMALHLPLPKRIICHNHWLMSNRKMSKSLGNVVNPFFAIQRWDTDPLRYFLMRNSNFSKDMDYSNNTIAVMYLKEMQACIGNLFLRVVKPKATVRWSALEAVQLYVSGAFKHLDAFRENPKHAVYFDLEPYLANTAAEFSEYMKDYNTNDAIGRTWELLSQTNRYVSDCKPWELVKEDSESCLLAHWVIYRCSEALRIAAILLQPVMPAKAERLLDEMAVKADRRTVAYAKPDSDDDYGPENTSIVEPNFDRSNRHLSIFPPVVSADASKVKELQEFRRRTNLLSTSPVTQMSKFLVMEARIKRGPMPDLQDPVPDNEIFLKRSLTRRATYREEQETESMANMQRSATVDETTCEASQSAERATLEAFLRGPDDESWSALSKTSTNQMRVPTLESTGKEKDGAKPTEDWHQQVPNNLGSETQSPTNPGAPHGSRPHGGYWRWPQQGGGPRADGSGPIPKGEGLQAHAVTPRASCQDFRGEPAVGSRDKNRRQ